MNFRKSDTVGFIAVKNLQATSIFNSYGIDYYAHGNRTLEAACLEENVPMTAVLEELYALNERSQNLPDFSDMGMVALATYILRTHHKFAEKKLVYIRRTMDRLTWNTGDTQPDLMAVKEKFEELSLYLRVHMKHEEFVVFPSIIKAARTARVSSSVQQTIQNPIFSMMNDHDHEVETLRKLVRLTNNFLVPVTADYALKATYNAMKELVEDLKIHMHLENNILFPKALRLSHAIADRLN